jgi:cysteine-S-conjugate beta-lyase
MNDFARPVDRIHSDSIKWNKYAPDVLPLWVADMDFISPPCVLQALAERVAHGVFGYGTDSERLTEVVVARLHHLYGWRVSPPDVVYLPGVVPGFNLACLAFAGEGQRVVVQTPVYSPLLHAPFQTGRDNAEVGFIRDAQGSYTIDWDDFERTIADDARLFISCNPHNPLGRVFTRGELERMADICMRSGVLMCSDEIHCDLLYPGQTHVPLASLDPEIAQSTVTLLAPSKTYNLAGLQCSFAVIQNETMRKQFVSAARGLLAHLNTLGCTAALAAYGEGQTWLDDVLHYLAVNRDTLLAYVRKYMPQLRVTQPEGTYLAWIDCSEDERLEQPYHFFLKEAKVALSDGLQFGATGQQHVRLNFGCRRELLLEALDRMRASLD